MKKILKAEILKNESISSSIFEMIISAGEIASETKAGQFINLYTGLGEALLPRPISICEIDHENKTLRLIYQVVGKGTNVFSDLKQGEFIKVLGPLGNGFTVDKDIFNHVVIGGGIGVPPLLQLVKELNGKKSVFLGARSSHILVDEFKKYGADVYLASDDGSEGFHGNVLELVKEIKPDVDKIYACGPKIMLKYVSEYSNSLDIKGQISMEERMACGIGACVGCAVKIKKDENTDFENLKVCKDGPVFLSNEVIWDD